MIQPVQTVPVAEADALRGWVHIAGVMEEGRLMASEKGTPQGGVISPILANIYLHYGLDLWFERRFRPSSGGRTRLIRYADDFVVTFQQEEDARRFRQELEERLALFGLSLASEKTRVIEFGPLGGLMPIMAAKLRGHYAYYGVTDNSNAIARIGCEAKRMLFKWLDRRGKRGNMNWEKFNHHLKLFPLPVPCIRVNLF